MGRNPDFLVSHARVLHAQGLHEEACHRCAMAIKMNNRQRSAGAMYSLFPANHAGLTSDEFVPGDISSAWTLLRCTTAGLAVRRLPSVGAHEVALATLEALGDDEATKQRQHLSYFLWYLDDIDRLPFHSSVMMFDTTGYSLMRVRYSASNATPLIYSTIPSANASRH